jgi:molybdopterin-guanine dinucleotide biosynthesis protein A
MPAGFVLVGGRSRRMGRDKALLDVDGRPLLLHLAEVVRPFVRHVTLLGPPERYAGFALPVLADRYPNAGSLGALCTALEDSSCEWNLFFACDLPLLRPEVVEHLAKRAAAGLAQAVVPKAEGRWQPLCAAYHRSCLPAMQAAVRGENLSVIRMLSGLRVEELLPPAGMELPDWERSLRNVNTAAEWAALRSVGWLAP